MKREKNDILQRMLTGKLTQDEKMGYSPAGRQCEEDKSKPAEPRKVSFALTKIERVAVFQDVRQRVLQGTSADEIGKAVLACLDEILSEKEELAYGAESPVIGQNQKGKGGFKRAD
jgi:hypothetical protein